LFHFGRLVVSHLAAINVFVPKQLAASALLRIEIRAGALEIGDEICGVRAVIAVFEQQIRKGTFQAGHGITLVLKTSSILLGVQHGFSDVKNTTSTGDIHGNFGQFAQRDGL
jgi:hypothetical protein